MESLAYSILLMAITLVIVFKAVLYDYTTNTIYPTICINTYIDKATVYATSGLNAQNARLTTILLIAIERILRLRWKNFNLYVDTCITACIHACGGCFGVAMLQNYQAYPSIFASY